MPKNHTNILVFLLSITCATAGAGVHDPADNLRSTAGLDDFGGLVFAAFDDGQSARPSTATLSGLRRTTSAKLGERLVLHTVITQPKPDALGFARVRCHFKATRPDKTVSFQQQDIACLQGKISGSHDQAFLSSMWVQFKANADDTPGRWLFEVELHDINSNARRTLQTYLDLRGEKDRPLGHD